MLHHPRFAQQIFWQSYCPQSDLNNILLRPLFWWIIYHIKRSFKTVSSTSRSRGCRSRWDGRIHYKDLIFTSLQLKKSNCACDLSETEFKIIACHQKTAAKFSRCDCSFCIVKVRATDKHK